jgi:alpha/beta superfamily hydrolase
VEKKRVYLTVDGVNIAAEVYFPKQISYERCPALCVCHGIPAGPPDPNDKGYPLLAQRFCTAGFVTMLFNFRGTGPSGGNLDMLGWSRDLEAAIDYLYHLSEVDKEHLALMGFSGGAAVSVYVAAHEPRVSSIVLCACPSRFDFLPTLAGEQPIVEHFRSIGTIRDPNFPPSAEQWLKGFEVIAPIHWIDKISPRPILIIHGEEDEIVNVSHARALHHKAGKPKNMIIIEGAQHRLRHDKKAMDAAFEWLKITADID